jgi:hypothetical protein
MKNGWIKIHRKIFDCVELEDEKYSKREAWIWLIANAAYEDRTFALRGILVKQRRGQVAKGTRELADLWGWSRMKVIRFISMLEMLHMVRQEKSNVINLISIVNYERYQIDETTGETTGETTDETTDETTNKKIKNKRREEYKEKDSTYVESKKKVFSPPAPDSNLPPLGDDAVDYKSQVKRAAAFVPPTADEVREYCDERGNGIDPEAFRDFYESKGWYVGKNKMKDWKAAVRTWERKDREMGRPAAKYRTEFTVANSPKKPEKIYQ